MAGRKRRPPDRRGKHDRLDRNDPVQRDKELRATRIGERRRLSGAADRHTARDHNTMEPLTRSFPAWDGLPLRIRIWDNGDRLPPILCLPGLVRTAGDFDTVGPLFAEGRRIVALDYAGRGGSGRSSDVARYAPEACLRD